MKHPNIMMILSLLFCGAIGLLIQTGQPHLHETAHTVHISHPDHEQMVLTRELIQVTDSQGTPKEYYLDVNSVSCGQTCRIIKVRLHWDLLGNYLRYELLNGEKLTKKAHLPFSDADYQKLQSILLNKDSAWRSTQKNQITAGHDDEEEIDTITGATALSDADTYVAGAAYTCFTLWHWAQGELPELIRQLTVASCSDRHLNHLLNSGNDTYAAFSVKQLTQRRAYDSETQANVIRQIKSGSNSVVNPALNYLLNAPGEVYFQTLTNLLRSTSPSKRKILLDSLSKTTQAPPAGFIEQLSAELPNLDTYYEIHQLLSLIEKHPPVSAESIRHILPLLEKDFFIARRAFYALSGLDLDAESRHKCDQFSEQHAGRL